MGCVVVDCCVCGGSGFVGDLYLCVYVMGGDGCVVVWLWFYVVEWCIV